MLTKTGELSITQRHSEPSQTFKTELLATIIDAF